MEHQTTVPICKQEAYVVVLMRAEKLTLVTSSASLLLPQKLKDSWMPRKSRSVGLVEAFKLTHYRRIADVAQALPPSSSVLHHATPLKSCVAFGPEDKNRREGSGSS